MQFLKNISQMTFMLIFVLISMPFIAICGPVDSLSLSTPAGYASPEAQAALTAAITTIFAFFSGALPFLKKIPDTTIRSIATGLLILAGAGALKTGFVTDETLKFAFDGLLPNFAYSTIIYKILQGVTAGARMLGWLPKEAQLKSIKPA